MVCIFLLLAFSLKEFLLACVSVHHSLLYLGSDFSTFPFNLVTTLAVFPMCLI